ncbi:Ig-like domain-containing protein [Flavobacterium humi]|uniref:Uncharacterized protein n=1 Tax=Flavobacterium humi TaxID=2562683 RepID=A0A4Z0L4F5_9FLAO|nr:hypothetical protein [Flavobacterium humi]TGD56560.1 hypothetical protein E4635_15365 [Flavobacterium humi]
MAEKKNLVTIRARKEDIKNADALVAYLVNGEGELIESAPFKGGDAQFKAEAKSIQGTKIFIAPAVPAEAGKRKITEKTLLKMGAWQPSARLGLNNAINLPLLPPIIHPLPFKWCHVTGTLTKSFTIDGINKVLPVCNARVHICEVDPIKIIWPQIPDKVITDLWWRLKEIIRKPISLPDPVPGPIRGPIRFPKPLRDLTPLINTRIDAKLTDFVKRSEIINQQAKLPVFPLQVQNAILSDSISVFSDSLRNNFTLFHPYLCLWPWYWPWFYKTDPIATVTTDCNGQFDYKMLLYLLGDHPDIYIWVETLIDGQWVTVYRPRIACNTFWNYSCGSNINIRITDPRVTPCVCDPLPGAIVWMKRVNSGVSIRNIQQNENASGHLANAVGLTNFASSNKTSPFGSSFPFVVQFGSGFPNASVTHYRWKFRKLKDGYLQNDISSIKMLEGEVAKPYTYEVETPDGTVFASDSFRLGPIYDAAGIPRYKIPHVEASDDVPQPTAEWNQDTASININSLNLSDGLYEFIFELLDNAGNVVSVPANTFVVDTKLSTGPSTVIADGLPENYVVNVAGKTSRFTFKMRIDNTKCYADVLDALVDGNTTDTECGFGHYNNKAGDFAALRFLAGQEHDFASYSFAVTKGNSNPVGIANAADSVTVPNNGYSISPVIVGGVIKDKYEKNNIPLATMLGTCTLAAFAEVLHVSATHTDGSRILREYDAGDTAAIAIAP